jgi:acetyl-CoA C-acetyltransferase
MTMTQELKTQNEVYVISVGRTPVGEHWEKSLRELALDAITDLRMDGIWVRPQALYVANMLAPYLSGQTQLAALLADFAGLRGIEAITIEAAGASGGAAARQAYLAIMSGVIDVALIVGVEKVTERTSPELEAALSTSSDADHEAVHGVTPTAQAALLMRRYLHEYNVPNDAFAGFSLNAHANAATNPQAIYQRIIRIENYLNAPMVSEPVNLFDAAPLADGAAAILMARRDALPDDLPHSPIRVAASSIVSNAVALHDRSDPLLLDSVVESSAQALHQADLNTGDIDVFELHDRFSIFAALSLEAAGFAARGEGWRLAHDGIIAKDGDIPICTFGGSKARGDTGGATGVYQLVEITLQLQGRAGENQVQGAEIGMAQCLAASGATAATHIFIREDGP